MKYIKKFNTAEEVAMYDPFNLVLVADTDTVLYDVPTLNGVYIQHVNGNLYTTDNWAVKDFANDDANGVAVITEECSFVIAKNDASTSSLSWGSDTSTAIDGVMLTTDPAIAKTDYAGATNTSLIAAKYGAAYECANYVFPNGKKGYLPALGELVAMYANKAAIDSAMALIEGGTLNSAYYWSSTQYSEDKAWRFYNGNASYGTKRLSDSYSHYARAFTTL